MEFNEWVFNEFTSIEKLMRGNEVSLTVNPDSYLDWQQKPIFQLVVTPLENTSSCLTCPVNVWWEICYL